MPWDGELRTDAGELRIHGEVRGVVFELRGRMDLPVVEAVEAAAGVAFGAHQHVTVDLSRIASADPDAAAAMAMFFAACEDEVLVTGEELLAAPLPS